MIDLRATEIIDDFLAKKQEIFTVEEFCKYLSSQSVKIAKDYAKEVLETSPLVFSLINNEYITRAGVFTGRWFSFKPTREEIKKGYIVIGHRCMPFVNPEIAPDRIKVANEKYIVESQSVKFSMNMAMDLFALYGEGYVIPYIYNDKANTDIPLASVKYSMPSDICLTAWSLEKICDSKDYRYGDRILCRVLDWKENIVEMMLYPAERDAMIISPADIEREDWYSNFENGLLESINKNGPGNSIEEQLAFLYLENQEHLCLPNCGSAEEFLQHTKKIAFCPYGVETRIWKTGESVPYIGEWNRGEKADSIFSNMMASFTPQIIDGYLEDYLYKQAGGKKDVGELNDLIDRIFPKILKISAIERKLINVNVERRYDYLKKNNLAFGDKNLAAVRGRIMKLYEQVNELLCSISCSGLQLKVFPQQELVILVQLFNHMTRIIEEMENEALRPIFPVNDVSLSLEGMEDTFDDVGITLKNSLEVNTYKAIKLVNNKSE